MKDETDSDVDTWTLSNDDRRIDCRSIDVTYKHSSALTLSDLFKSNRFSNTNNSSRQNVLIASSLNNFYFGFSGTIETQETSSEPIALISRKFSWRWNVAQRFEAGLYLLRNRFREFLKENFHQFIDGFRYSVSYKQQLSWTWNFIQNCWSLSIKIRFKSSSLSTHFLKPWNHRWVFSFHDIKF